MPASWNLVGHCSKLCGAKHRLFLSTCAFFLTCNAKKNNLFPINLPTSTPSVPCLRQVSKMCKCPNCRNSFNPWHRFFLFAKGGPMQIPDYLPRAPPGSARPKLGPYTHLLSSVAIWFLEFSNTYSLLKRKFMRSDCVRNSHFVRDQKVNSL